MQSDALTHQSGTLASAAAARLPLVIGETYLLVMGLEGDNFNTETVTPKLFTGDNKGDKAQGTLTIDTIPTVGDPFVVGDRDFVIVAAGNATRPGDVALGADLAACQASIVAAINGTDGINQPDPDVTIAAFAANAAVLTATAAGIEGNSIVTTETFTAGTNVFDAATLGTTTAGTDDFTNEVSALPTPGSSDSDGSPQEFAAPGMVYFDAGLPELVLEPSGAVTSVRYFLTLLKTVRGLRP